MTTEINGKIIKALSGFYYVLVNDKIIKCRARGNFRNENITPLVGDIVKISIENDLGYVIEIEERKNELLRPKVANIDYNVIVTSFKSPVFSSKLLDKLIVLNEYSEVETIIVFTKLDILNSNELNECNKIMNYYKQLGYNVFTNSNCDIQNFKNIVGNKFISISGQSGSGKSSFINKLSDNKLEIETARISKALGRGKHTTRHIEFHKIGNFYIADTPGFSSLDISFIEKDELKYLFKEFKDSRCKFQTCNHINEPNCEVKNNIIETDYINTRYENYKILFKEKEEQKRRY